MQRDPSSVFSGIADVLIPQAEGMPSASQAAGTSDMLETILRFRPDLQNTWDTALATVADMDAASGAAALAARDPAAFTALSLAIAALYYTHESVRTRIGYAGQTARPLAPDGIEAPAYEALLAGVIERGPIFRPTPR